MTKLPLAPIKRIAVEGGAQRIGIPAAEMISLAGVEWIKRVTNAAEKYANHAGRKTIKPEDIIIVVKDMGINVQVPQKAKPAKAKKPAVTQPVAAPVTFAPSQAVQQKIPPLTMPPTASVQKPAATTLNATSVQETLKAQAQVQANITKPPQ